MDNYGNVVPFLPSHHRKEIRHVFRRRKTASRQLNHFPAASFG
jgi:hypothetical protein